MRRREFITLLGGVAAAWPLPAKAQQAGKVYRIGILEPTSQLLNSANFDAFRQGLRELGYIEGQNYVIDYRSADGHDERFPDLATELVRLNVDLILTRGTPAALAAKNATRTIPIVLAGLGDPVANGVVASLAHPGANVTGLSSSTTELQQKRLELIKELLPQAERFVLLTNMGNLNERLNWEETKMAARSLNVGVELLDVRNPEEFEHAFDDATKQRADALVVAGDGLLLSNRRLIVDLAAKYRLPANYVLAEFVDSGGLIAYGPSFPDQYRRAATYVDKIFKGAKPADLPVELPTKFRLVINLKTAKALGLTVPPSVLSRADEVIE
jgi:putative tryptophan/tyrosine transport system substrate-binding protein